MRFADPPLPTVTAKARRPDTPLPAKGTASALVVACLAVLGVIPASTIDASARDSRNQRSDSGPFLNAAQRANQGVVGIITGGVNGTYIRIAADLANVLDGDDLRVLPVIGRGSLQNLVDIMFLRGIDIGIVQMDARAELTKGQLGGAANRRLRYIARLYNEEIHILAGKNIATLADLQGKRVNIDNIGSGTSITAKQIFEKAGISAAFTNFDQASSYERLRAGEIEAAVFVAGRPVTGFTTFRDEGRFHLVSVPFEGSVAEAYLPATLSATDYPRLIEQGKDVKTVAVGSVLAVFNWGENSARFAPLKRFTELLFARFKNLQQPGHHPKWKEVNLSATVPGWERFKPARDLIDRLEAPQRPVTPAEPARTPDPASGRADRPGQ